MDQQMIKGRQPRRVWNILRWIPFGSMAGTALAIAGILAAGGMFRISGWYLMQLLPPAIGLIALIAIVVYAVVTKRTSRAWKLTLALSLVSLLPLVTWVVPVAYPSSLERMSPSATVRLPADQPLRVAWGGDSIRTNQHAAVPDQRWAYDLVVEPYFTGSSNLEEYGCYGIPVLAPAGGTVVSAHDGEPDEVPGVPSNNVSAATGNHVMIRLEETGTYLVIAHLKRGSVAVETGDIVEEGRVIGECGNSGNTSEPHIHIHHQRQDPTVFPLNFAEGLPLYFRDHDGPAMPVGGFLIEGDSFTATGDVVQHIGK